MIESRRSGTGGKTEGFALRYTQPEPDLQILIKQLKLSLPPQPPPRITAAIA